MIYILCAALLAVPAVGGIFLAGAFEKAGTGPDTDIISSSYKASHALPEKTTVSVWTPYFTDDCTVHYAFSRDNSAAEIYTAERRGLRWDITALGNENIIAQGETDGMQITVFRYKNLAFIELRYDEQKEIVLSVPGFILSTELNDTVSKYAPVKVFPDGIPDGLILTVDGKNIPLTEAVRFSSGS